jgi:hypothetical protein
VGHWRLTFAKRDAHTFASPTRALSQASAPGVDGTANGVGASLRRGWLAPVAVVPGDGWAAEVPRLALGTGGCNEVVCLHSKLAVRPN